MTQLSASFHRGGALYRDRSGKGEYWRQTGSPNCDGIPDSSSSCGEQNLIRALHQKKDGALGGTLQRLRPEQQARAGKIVSSHFPLHTRHLACHHAPNTCH